MSETLWEVEMTVSSISWTHSKKRGFTLIEIVIVMGILALSMLPLYNVIIGERIKVTKAKFAYVAVQLARETIEETMSIPYDLLESKEWDKIQGPVVSEELLKIVPRGGKGKNSSSLSGTLSGGAQAGTRVGTNIGKSVIDSSLQVGEGEYPAQYSRFERKITITKKGKRLKKIEVEIRWYEKGEQDRKENRYLYSLSTLVGNHHLSGYK